MKVLFVAQSGSVTGASHSMADLAVGLQEAGHETHVLVPKAGPIEVLLTKRGLTYERVDAKPWVGEITAPNFWRRHQINALQAASTARKFRGSGYNLVYTNTITSPFAGMLAKKLHLPNVWQIRENLPSANDGERESNRLKWMRRNFDSLSTMAIGNSKHIYSQVESWVGEEKARLVYSGPFDDAETNRPITRSAKDGPPFFLVMLGRISSEKRQEEAVLAVKALADEGIDVRLTLAGTTRDDYVKKVQDTVKSLGVSDRVKMISYTDNPRALYEGAHVNLNCTLNEPLGRTILEGLAFGCPTVASNGGGTPEVITDSVNGLLYEPGDVEGLACQIKRIIQDPSFTKNLLENARNSVLPMFTRGRYVRDTLGVFDEALARFGT